MKYTASRDTQLSKIQGRELWRIDADHGAVLLSLSKSMAHAFAFALNALAENRTLISAEQARIGPLKRVGEVYGPVVYDGPTEGI